jgi:hypothetical protein
MLKMISTKFAVLAFAVFCVTEFAMAGLPIVPITTFSGTEANTASIGLRFEFGDNTAQVVGQVRHTYTNTDNNVTGALVEIAVPIFPDMNFAPKIRAMGLIGSTSFQGEAGVGYDFANQQPLVGFGVQGPYFEAGANFLFDGEFHPYVGVDTFGGAPGATSTTVFVPVPIPD